MLKRVLNNILVYLLGAIIICFDQYTKYLVRLHVPLNESWSPWPWLAPYARVLHINNTGAAFGMFKAGGAVFTVIAIVVALLIAVYARRLPQGYWWMRLALGLQLGGAVGNLIDRLVYGPVTDFVSVSSFAIFNVADASISLGVALLVILMWQESRAERQELAEGRPPVDSVDVGEAT